MLTKALALAVVLASLPIAAEAAKIVYADDGSHLFPVFDTSLGHLTNVQLKLDVRMLGTVTVFSPTPGDGGIIYALLPAHARILYKDLLGHETPTYSVPTYLLGESGSQPYFGFMDTLHYDTLVTQLINVSTEYGLFGSGPGQGMKPQGDPPKLYFTTTVFEDSVDIRGDAPHGITTDDAAFVKRYGVTESLIYTYTPEPAAWALMLLGFAGVGFRIRNGRRLALLA